MKATGIVRKIDNLGRIVIPKELRTHLELFEDTTMEIFIDGDMIVLRKYEPFDIFTGETEDLIEFHGKRVSMKSVKAMASIVKSLEVSMLTKE